MRLVPATSRKELVASSHDATSPCDWSLGLVAGTSSALCVPTLRVQSHAEVIQLKSLISSKLGTNVGFGECMIKVNLTSKFFSR